MDPLLLKISKKVLSIHDFALLKKLISEVVSVFEENFVKCFFWDEKFIIQLPYFRASIDQL